MQSRRGELRWRTWTKPSGSQSEAQSEGSSDGAHGRNRADRNQRRNQRGAPMAHMDETERIAIRGAIRGELRWRTWTKPSGSLALNRW